VVDWQMDKRSKIEDPGAFCTGDLILRSSGLVLLSLLLLYSFAQAHLIKLRPFRATDTDLSGGDHICDIRRDSDHDGRPDRLGDFVSLSGTVIAEPSTYETGGWLFWIRTGSCGVLVYGEQETYQLGDSVSVKGWLRCTNGNYFFPETGLATLGDIAIENGGTRRIKSGCNHDPLNVYPPDFSSHPEIYGGNLIRVALVEPDHRVYREGEDIFIRLYFATDSLNLYIDGDIGLETDIRRLRCLVVTGIVVRMKTPPNFAPSPTWCIAPRCPQDIIAIDEHSTDVRVAWGRLKALFAP